MLMKFEDIIIPKIFKQSSPSPRKIRQCSNFLKKTGKYDRDLVVNDRGVLLDGYVLYCVLAAENYSGDIDVERRNYGSRTYIFGKHPNNDKEFVWYINMSYEKVKDKIGGTALVNTNYGVKPITITRIERLATPPISGEIKKVCYI